jgi:hypothetical protein
MGKGKGKSGARGWRNGNWKGGTTVNNTGKCKSKCPYLRISAGPHRGRYVHELVMEGMLRRPLGEDETVDHLNEDGLDPEWTNLEVVSQAENTRRMHARRKKKRAEDKVREKARREKANARRRERVRAVKAGRAGSSIEFDPQQF